MKTSRLTTGFFALALGLGAFTMNAQEGFYIGVKGIPQFSTLLNSDDADDDDLENQTTIGGAFGLGLGYNFTDNFGIAVDGLYSIEGQRREFLGTEFTQQLSYIKVPVMFTFSTGPAPVSFQLKVGPQAHILADAKLLDKDGDELIDDITEQYSDFLIGGVLGLGVTFQITDSFLMDAGVRTDIGFVNAEDDEADGYDPDRANTMPLNAGLEIGFRYLF